jgi:hypothetical protein
MAYIFNGTNRLQNLGFTTTFSLPVTIAAMIKPYSHPSTFVAIGDSATIAGYTGIAFNASGQSLAFARDTAQAQGFSQSAASAPVNQWCHAAGVFSSTNSRTVYLNGVVAPTNTVAISADTNRFNRLNLGGRAVGANFESVFNGELAEVAIWTVALTAPEILSLSKGFNPRLIRPNSLVIFNRLLRPQQDIRNGIVLSNTGNVLISNDHPLVI